MKFLLIVVVMLGGQPRQVLVLSALPEVVCLEELKLHAKKPVWNAIAQSVYGPEASSVLRCDGMPNEDLLKNTLNN